MIPWVVNYRSHLRQAPQSRASLSSTFQPANVSNTPTFGFPYLLPSSVSCNSFVCHSFANFACWTVLRDENCRVCTNNSQNEKLRSCPKGKSFNCNTYGSPRKCCKQRTYFSVKPFRCNTYKKPGEGSQLWLTRNPVRSTVLSNHRERRSMCPRPCGATNHQSRVSPSSVAAFPAGCYDLVFHVPC